MLRALRKASLLTVALLAAPVIGNAQYIYVDANGDGVNTAADRLNASGTTQSRQPLRVTPKSGSRNTSVTGPI